MKNIQYGGVTSPKGFKAAGIHAGLKKNRKDMALIYSKTGCAFAGVFTRNQVQAAPVLYCKALMDMPQTKAVLVNAGNANACTGQQGLDNAREMARQLAYSLNIAPEEVLVSSTGVIGYQLPMDKISAGIGLLLEKLNRKGGAAASRAIMTTDTFPKQRAVELDLDGVSVKVGGMAKGSGMIHPNMATMLCFVTTDCAIEKDCLQGMISDIADRTFNMITVDGDTSTNDMLLCLANGRAKNRLIQKASDPGYAQIYDALYAVCRDLAIAIARDGEGATKLLTVNVSGAASVEDARKAARTVCTSSLVKTALFGRDANWGRILAAVGYSGVSFDPSKVDIFLESSAGRIQVAAGGAGIAFSEEEALRILNEKEVTFDITMGEGNDRATAWSCDLTYAYVKINGSYRS